MAARVGEVKDSQGNRHGWMFECPGCGFAHLFDHRWAFNGDVDRPTFTPSLLVNANALAPELPVCHLFMTDGKIRFLEDSTHSLAGQVVDAPPWNGTQ